MSIRGAREGVSFFSEEKHYSTFPGAPCHSDDIEFRRSRRREFGEPPRVLGVLWGLLIGVWFGFANWGVVVEVWLWGLEFGVW